MHLHLPKPPHGWREFLSEVAVIVVGISIAIRAEQTVEWFHHRSEVNEAIESLRAESIENRATLTYSIDNLREQVKAIDVRLDVLGNCNSPVARDNLAAVTPSTTLVPSDTAWLGLRDSALLPLMPKDIADNCWKMDSAYSFMLSDLDAVIRSTDDARAAVDVVRRGISNPDACADAARSLLRQRASMRTLWRQLAFYQSGNEQVLRGERLGVGTAERAVRDSTASLKGN